MKRTFALLHWLSSISILIIFINIIALPFLESCFSDTFNMLRITSGITELDYLNYMSIALNISGISFLIIILDLSLSSLIFPREGLRIMISSDLKRKHKNYRRRELEAESNTFIDKLPWTSYLYIRIAGLSIITVIIITCYLITHAF